MLDKIKFEANIDVKSIEKLNSEFSIAKAYIMYHGDNRNNSSMSKEVVEKALPTIYNVPVIGEFIEKKEDFGGHGGKIIISGEGIEYVQTTVPFGVLPESANPRWEMITHEDGEEKEYLVADIILWSGRYKELDVTIEEYSQQSMEINIGKGDFNQDGVFVIDEFEFSALCLLGLDVEPCFEESKIVTYSIDEFKTEMDLFMSRYKEFKNERKELVMEDLKEFEVETSDEVVESQETEETVADVETEEKFEENSNTEETVEVAEETVEETTEEVFEETVESDTNEETQVEEDYKVLYEDLKLEFDTLKADNEKVVEELNSYKLKEREEAESEIFSQYEESLSGNAEFDALKEKSSDYSLVDLEKELALIYVKSNNAFTKKDSKKDSLVVEKFSKKEEKSESRYGDLFEKHGK